MKLFLKNKSIIIFIILLILVFSIMFFYNNFKNTKTLKKENEIKEEPISNNPNIRTFNLKGYDETKMVWELFGETAEINFHNDKNKIKIIHPLLYFYDQENKVETEMKANHSIVDIKTNDISAFGDVILKTYKENATIFTDSVFYDKKKDIFFSDSFFRLERIENITEGLGFVSTRDLKEINLKKNVNIKYTVKPKEK